MSTPNITTKQVTLPSGNGDMQMYVAMPTKAERAPALIVLQEAFGVNSHIRSICERLAREGYVAAAPELFHRSGKGLEFNYDEFPKIRPIFSSLTNEHLTADVAATFAWLNHSPQVDPERIGAIGYCMGGFAATLASITTPIKTAVSYYGGGLVEARPGMAMRPLITEFSKIRAPMLFVFGDQDHGIPQTQVEAIRHELTRLKKVHEIIVYQGADHGFFCDERPSYHASAAAMAWERTLAWLKTHLTVS